MKSTSFSVIFLYIGIDSNAVRCTIRFLRTGRREWRAAGVVTTLSLRVRGNVRTLPSARGNSGQPSIRKINEESKN